MALLNRFRVFFRVIFLINQCQVFHITRLAWEVILFQNRWPDNELHSFNKSNDPDLVETVDSTALRQTSHFEHQSAPAGF